MVSFRLFAIVVSGNIDSTTVLATVQDLCKLKPGMIYNFPKDEEIYTTTAIAFFPTSSNAPSTSSFQSSTLSSSGLSTGRLVGIALVGTALVLGAIQSFLRKRKNRNKRMPVAQGENGYGHTDAHGPGDGVPVGKYSYSTTL